MDLKNKTIIVTGASRIGQSVVRALQDKGANVVIAYFQNPEEAQLGVGVQADVSKEEDIHKIIEVARDAFGRIDGLVHMAATYERTPWHMLNGAAFDRSMQVIARSTFLFGKILGDEMLRTEGDRKGSMIFFSDWSVLTRPYVDYLAYNVAKSAVVGITKSLAKELAPGILVNALAPGPMMRPADLSDEENEEVLAGTLLKRWGGAEEIAKGVIYLLESDFMTGQVLTIDGGRTVA